jgi:hypothetical protein
MSEEEGGESGDEEDDGVEGEASAIMGPKVGSVGTEGGVSQNQQCPSKENLEWRADHEDD